MNGSIAESAFKQNILAMSLTLTAGYIDGYGLLVLNTYVSYMSGNTTTVGVMTGQTNFQAAIAPAIAVFSFLGGSVVGNLVTHSQLRYSHRILFGLIAALLIAVLVLDGDHSFKNVEIALLSLGMGMVNPGLSKVGAESVGMTFVTGTLSRMGGHFALALKRVPVPGSQGPWDTHLYRARIDAQLWASFLCGAILSGAALSVGRTFVLLPGIAIMLVLALVSPAENHRP
jgi:uncharacterized membrane protein YoaK (UPF0700 family)